MTGLRDAVNKALDDEEQNKVNECMWLTFHLFETIVPKISLKMKAIQHRRLSPLSSPLHTLPECTSASQILIHQILISIHQS